MDLKHTFSENPVSVNIPRSRFDMNHRVKVTFNAGALVPLDVMEVLPGTTVEDDLGSLVRMLAAPLVPTMDTAVLSVYAFFVPNRILWSHWEELQGANKTDAWTQSSEFVLPLFQYANDIPGSTFATDNDAVAPGSALDYLGLPTSRLQQSSKHSTTGLSVLPIAAYGKIWEDWFRDENLQDPLSWVKSIYDSASGASFTAKQFRLDSDTILTQRCLPANKFHDVYTSCLPAPQKGGSIVLPLGDTAKLTTGDDFYEFADEGQARLGGENVDGVLYGGASVNLSVQNGQIPSGVEGVTHTNILVDLSEATAATINDLRYAFALQRILERDARGGTRYVEQLYSFFGVRNGDSRLQRPEFIAGANTNIGIQQVENNSNTNTGSLGAYSLTFGKNPHFIKSFTEHGILMYVACVRHKPSYGQGITPFWRKSRRYDFYLPPLAHIGEQPVPKIELYAYGSDVDVRATNLSTFGFNEAWYENRFMPDRVAGLVRPGTTYDTQYTYVDEYAAPPTLSDTWIREDPINIAKTQGLDAQVIDAVGQPVQFIGDFYFQRKVTAPMPVYSVPGLIDHY